MKDHYMLQILDDEFCKNEEYYDTIDPGTSMTCEHMQCAGGTWEFLDA